MLVFLAQFEFWEFEVENLIFVFQTFADRQKIWNDFGSLEQKIRSQNWIVKKKYLDKFFYSQSSVRKYNPYRWNKGGVVGPLDLLKSAIEGWNNLLDDCQHLLVDEKDVKIYKLAGAKIEKDFTKFKKSVPGLVELAFTEEVEGQL